MVNVTSFLEFECFSAIDWHVWSTAIWQVINDLRVNYLIQKRRNNQMLVFVVIVRDSSNILYLSTPG